MPTEAEIEAGIWAEWPKALKHAGFDESQAHLWLGRGPHDEQVGAHWYIPVMNIEGDHGLSDEQLAHAHSDEFRGRHRVVIYPEYDFDGKQDRISEQTITPLFGAMIRHELQHAIQQEASGNEVLFLDQVVVDEVLATKVNKLPGGAALRNTKPLEQDANDAAASYLRDQHPDVVETILNEACGHLARSLTGPEDPATLLTRTVCFLYTHSDLCRQISGDISFEQRLAVYDKRAGTLWKELEAAQAEGNTNEEEDD
jgi:hypothetical protein